MWVWWERKRKKERKGRNKQRSLFVLFVLFALFVLFVDAFFERLTDGIAVVGGASDSRKCIGLGFVNHNSHTMLVIATLLLAARCTAGIIVTVNGHDGHSGRRWAAANTKKVRVVFAALR